MPEEGALRHHGVHDREVRRINLDLLRANDHVNAAQWLDQQQLPRRFRMNIATAQVSVRFQFDFADYGGSVDVQPPPTDDVTQATTVQQAIFLLQSAFRS